MTERAAPAQATVDYRPETPPDAPPERGRVALAAGSGPVAADDLYAVLRRRLLTLTWVMTGIFLFAMGMALVMAQIHPQDELAPAPSGPDQWVIRLWPQLLTLAISLASAIVLWRRPPSSVRGLRLIELIVVGSIVLCCLHNGVSGINYGFLEAAADEPIRVREAFFGRYGNAGGLLWCIVLTSYGALIPNTWRRCAAVVGAIAVSPLILFAVYGYWLRPLDPQMVAITLVSLTGVNAISSAIAIFASWRIEILRHQAAEARKLGQYVLREQLGAGGMGEVYRAEHVLLRLPCALKVIRPERAGDPKNLRRFEREVQVTATLTHPNTVQIYDYGHAADGTFYYVMEFLPGPNLEQLVKEHGPLPPERVVHLLRQVCGALREAHAAGLIHCDIKPSNVIVCERGRLPDVVKLLDFGIVDAPEPGPGGALTAQGQVVGTPLFMSPEQAAGMPDLDARSDLYSLGATAYFMLTGKAPFERVTPNLVIAAHLRDPVTPPHYLRTEIPKDLSAVIKRCLEKDPNQRYPDASSLEKALAECKCADQWSEERAVQANQSKVAGDGEQRVTTTELERRWGF